MTINATRWAARSIRGFIARRETSSSRRKQSAAACLWSTRARTRERPSSRSHATAFTSPHQDDVIEQILRDVGLWPFGLALRARLRARPSPPTAARCPAAPGSSPLASSRLSHRGSSSARREALHPAARIPGTLWRKWKTRPPQSRSFVRGRRTVLTSWQRGQHVLVVETLAGLHNETHQIQPQSHAKARFDRCSKHHNGFEMHRG